MKKITTLIISTILILSMLFASCGEMLPTNTVSTVDDNRSDRANDNDANSFDPDENTTDYSTNNGTNSEEDDNTNLIIQNLEYELNSDGSAYTVIGIGSVIDCDVYISSVYKDLPVTSIGNEAFRDCSSLKSITIPNSVTNIGALAFFNCSNIESITVENGNSVYKSDRNCLIEISSNSLVLGCKNSVIPDYVTSIGELAFGGCSGLTSITIPNNVESISFSAFNGCSNLESITIPFIGADVYGTPKFHFGSIFGAYSHTDHSDYYIPQSLKTVVITGSENIPASAFYNCSSIESIIIPDDVAMIGDGAFSYCSSLKNITIPDSVTYIGSEAFSQCTNLESITIPNGVMSIGDDVFDGCSNLKYNEYDNGYYLGNASCKYLVFVKAKSKDIKSCQMHTDTKFIHSDAFSECSSLEGITIPDGVMSIGDTAFFRCNSLKSATIGDGVTNIGRYAFYICSSLENVTIGKGVISINDYAFASCLSLKSIFFNGDMNKWRGIDKEFSWHDYTGDYIVICDNGTVTKNGLEI